MDRLKSALLPKVWQERHAAILNMPDSMSQVNNNSMQQNQKKTIGQTYQKKSKQVPKKCTTGRKLHRGVCRRTKKVPNTCNNCKAKNRPDPMYNSHPDSKCWEIHPEKIPPHIKENKEASKKQKKMAAIINEQAESSPEELIQRAKGRINPE